MNAAEKHQPHRSCLPKILHECSGLKTGPPHRMEPSFRTQRVSDEPPPTLKDVALFRNSPKQFVCVELLQEGNHKAFSELVSLLRSDRDQRAEAEPGSTRLQGPPLEDQRDKLEAIRLHLGGAEQAERTGLWTTVCEERLLLGRYFSAQGDLWLSLYFYHSCADRERGGGSKPASEARGHLAELYLQRGELQQARQQAERFLEQAKEGGWLDSNGRPLRLWACQVLWKIYTLLGDALLADKDYDTAMTLFHQSHSMATLCEDKSLEGEASFRLGLVCQSSGDHDAARQFFSGCVQIYSALQDAAHLVWTYRALAKSSQSEGNMDETLRLLETSADVCRSSNLHDKLSDIYLYLGNVYYSTNQHLKACEFFLQSFKEASEAGDVSLLQKAQVMVGSTCAPFLIRKYKSDMESTSSTFVSRLVVWKETRGHQDFCTDPAD